MSEAAAGTPNVMEKVFNILKRELSAEEYLIFLQTITPRAQDATEQLREITKKLSLEQVKLRAKKMEKTMNA